MPTKAGADSAHLQRKTAVIDDIKERFGNADAAVLTEYRGLTVTDLAVLRASLRPAAADYKVFKNTLARSCRGRCRPTRARRIARRSGRDRIRQQERW